MGSAASRTITAPSSPDDVRPLPTWARAKSQAGQQLDPIFVAGASLAALDAVVRNDAGWLGCWRQRLAVGCALATRWGRVIDEQGIRDAWHLRRTGADPGPAGRAYASWRELAGRSTSMPGEGRGDKGWLQDRVIRASRDFGLDPRRFEDLAFDHLAGSPLAAAAAVVDVVVRRDRGAEPLGFWCADLVLAGRLRWPVPVPLLARGLTRVGHGRIVRSGEGAWLSSVACAYASSAADAVDLAGELARRASALTNAAPRLRAKGARSAINALLEDDAVSGSASLRGLSDRAVRRLFDRLVSLGVVREISGRPTFRIYGL